MVMTASSFFIVHNASPPNTDGFNSSKIVHNSLLPQAVKNISYIEQIVGQQKHG